MLYLCVLNNRFHNDAVTDSLVAQILGREKNCFTERSVRRLFLMCSNVLVVLYLIFGLSGL